MANFHRQPLLDRLRNQSLRLLMSADIRHHSQASLTLPANFLDELSQCLDADLRQLEPCLSLLSRVTFAHRTVKRHDPQDLRVYLLWRRVHSKSRTTGSHHWANQFIEANLLKAASLLVNSPTSPGLVARAVHEDLVPILLRRFIEVDATPSQEFLRWLSRQAKPLTDLEVVTVAELILGRIHDETWTRLVPIYPQLLTFLLVLNYGDKPFLSRLWLACDRWPPLNELVRAYASTISDEAVKMTIFGKVIDSSGEMGVDAELVEGNC